MAQKIIRTLVDDLTGEGTEDISTHTILIDGAGVELDLTDGNYDELLTLLKPYLQAKNARRIRGSVAGKKRSRKSPSQRGDAAAIRAWASENGYEVSSRGRVPAPVLKAYKDAH